MAKHFSDQQADAMMAIDAQIKKMKVNDEASIAEYFRLYTELIFDFKWIGSVYDIYADDCKVHRENGLLLDGPHEVMKDTLRLTSAFPDMKVTMRDIFAKKVGSVYKLWRYYSMSGTNKTYSIWGPASDKAINEDACIAMSMATVEKINGRFQITKEFTMYSLDELRNTCKADACDLECGKED